MGGGAAGIAEGVGRSGGGILPGLLLELLEDIVPEGHKVCAVDGLGPLVVVVPLV